MQNEYSGTKSALHFWTLGIRPQLKPYNIKVVELLPPVVDTPLAHGADIAEDDNLKPMPPLRNKIKRKASLSLRQPLQFWMLFDKYRGDMEYF